MKAIAAVLVVLASGLVLSACGESAEEKAQAQVCDARDDIAAQLATLRDLPVAPSSIEPLQQGVQAIGDDLTQIKDAQADLAPDRKQAVQDAASAFGSQLTGIASDVVSGVTGGAQAEAQLTTALQQLENDFRAAFKPVRC